MASYIIRRLLLLLPTLLGITVITFLVMAWSPGGIQAAINNREGTMDPRQRAAVRAFYERKYGLNKPLPVQYLRWLNHVSPLGFKDTGVGFPSSWEFGVKPPDLGESINSRRPVLDLIEESLPITLLLNLITIPIVGALSTWSGILAAKNRGGLLDVGGGTILLGLWSVPTIWAGVLLVGYLANVEFVHWFPASGLHDLRADEMPFLPSFSGGFHRGWLMDTAWHLVLPIVCFSYGSFAFSSKLTRGAMLENTASDYVRTARAKGASENSILYRHVLRNGLLPLITSSAALLPALIGGSIVIENIFSIPGMGKLTVDAVFDKDPEMVMSTTLVASVLGLISYLAADIAYAVADPRVSFEARDSWSAGSLPITLPGPAEIEVDRSRTFWQQVIHDTMRNGGARLGAAWIGVLVLAAVFAPFLANTEPIAVKMNGHWSSPLARNLTPMDVILLATAVIAMTAIVLRRRLGKTGMIVLAAIWIVSVPSAYKWVTPPVTVDWQQWRNLDRAGMIEWKVIVPLPYSPNDYQRDDPGAPLQPPSARHPLGTEVNGGDVLSRLIHACRIALAIGVISTGIALAIGIVIGGLMGFFGGWLDLFGMRLIEMFEAIATLFLLITFVAFFGRNLYIMMAIIGLTSWTGNARFIRAEYFRLRNQDFVQAAIAGGLPLRSILFRHLLPNGISPLLVTTSFGIASAILYESILSFLGIGLVDEPSWGQMLNQALGVSGSFIWWIALYPGMAIFLTVFSYNLLGEALRDALDPKLLKD